MKFNKKNVKNGIENQNGFLITCVCSILFLLTLCYFGVNSGVKGTAAASDKFEYYLLSSNLTVPGCTSMLYNSCSSLDNYEQLDECWYCAPRTYKQKCYCSNGGYCQWADVSPGVGHTISDDSNCLYDGDGMVTTEPSYHLLNPGESKENCVKTEYSSCKGLSNYEEPKKCWQCPASDYDDGVKCWSCTESAIPIYVWSDYKPTSACFNDSWVPTDYVDRCEEKVPSYSCYRYKDLNVYERYILAPNSNYEVVNMSYCNNDNNNDNINDTYTINYDYNGGSAVGTVVSTAKINSNIKVSNPSKIIRTNIKSNNSGADIGESTSAKQEFKGWKFTTNGDSSSAEKGVDTGNTPTYYSWEVGDMATSSYVYFRNLTSAGSTVTMTAYWEPVQFYLPTISKSGYECKWYTNPAGTGTGYESKALYTPGKNDVEELILYAKCIENNSSTDVITCDAGEYYAGQGECNECPANYYCPGGDFYKSDTSPDNDSKKACPEGSSSPAGSDEKSDCKSDSSSNSPHVCEGSVDNVIEKLTFNSSACWAAEVLGKFYGWSSTQNCCLVKDAYNIKYDYNGGKKGEDSPTYGVVGGDALVSGYGSPLSNYSYVRISKPSKTVTITGNVNGTQATVGNSTSALQTFRGWTFSGGNTSTAKYGSSSSTINSSWSNANTPTPVDVQYFRNLSNTSGADVILTAHWTSVSVNVPTITSPTGYTCKWNTKADGSGDPYDNGASYTPSESSLSEITLYAQCKQNTVTDPELPEKVAVIPTASGYCRTLTYNNGTQTLTKTAGTGYTFSNNVKMNAGTYNVIATLNSGYKWSDNTTSTKTIRCSIDKATAKLELTEYSVSLKTGESNLIEYSYDGDGVLSCDSQNTTIAVCEVKDGKLLVTAKTVGNTEIILKSSAGTNYKESVANAVLIGVSENTSGGETPSKKTFTATFDANGGVLTGGNNKSCYTESTSCNITDLPTATREGYTFKGWGLVNTCDSGETNSITLDKDVKYYACWKNNSGTPSVDDEGNVEDNVQTGNVVIMLVFCLGLLVMGYAYYYFKSIKQN